MFSKLLALFGRVQRKPLQPTLAPPAPATSPSAAPVGPRAVLVGLSGAFAGAELELDQHDLAIGRDRRLCELALPAENELISELHCRLVWDAATGQVLIEDCWSTSGTYIGAGQQLEPGQARVLTAGERFYLGDPSEMFELRFE